MLAVPTGHPRRSTGRRWESGAGVRALRQAGHRAAARWPAWAARRVVPAVVVPPQAEGWKAGTTLLDERPRAGRPVEPGSIASAREPSDRRADGSPAGAAHRSRSGTPDRIGRIRRDASRNSDRNVRRRSSDGRDGSVHGSAHGPGLRTAHPTRGGQEATSAAGRRSWSRTPRAPCPRRSDHDGRSGSGVARRGP
jgi:hypothetical protein